MKFIQNIVKNYTIKLKSTVMEVSNEIQILQNSGKRTGG
jgi:hypothetical protein